MSRIQAQDTPLLAMTGIGKAFTAHRVLDRVGFDLRAGEVHVLSGENGAGKSTLIKILGGVHRDYEGEVRLQGEHVRFASPQEANRAGISIIHQELSLIPYMNVVDNIFLGRERTRGPGWMQFRQERDACRELLQQLGLEIPLDTPVGQLPISVQQNVEIAKALAFDARVIVMDEPTSSLSAPEARRLFKIIKDLTARGCGIIYISHKMDEIQLIADRITVLRDGKYVGTAPAEELPPAELIRWMVGRSLGEQFPRRAPHPGKVLLKLRDFTVPAPVPGRKLVDSVGLELRAGEIVGLAGLQGSGNTALMAGLFGAYGRTVRGQVELEGGSYRPSKPAAAIRRGLAYLTNDRKASGLVLEMDVAQNIVLASTPGLSPGGWLRPRLEAEHAEQHRESLSIRLRSVRQRVATLSGGNQQKVALAKWLETQPRVLLLDEPTRGVDIGAKHEIYELMQQWSEMGMGILLITSELPELLALSDRILVMHRGRVTRELQGAEATQEAVLAAAMGEEAAHA